MNRRRRRTAKARRRMARKAVIREARIAVLERQGYQCIRAEIIMAVIDRRKAH